MNKKTTIFGWKIALKSYGWNGFFLDSILPFIISISLCVLMYLKESDVYEQLKHIINIGIDIVPAMVALILTAYTIMLTFIIGNQFSSIKNTSEGKELIQSLNSSFAVCLLISTISIIVLIITSNIVNLKIGIQNPDMVNYPVFFFVCYLLVYSVSILIGIVIDIFNSGQTVLLDKKDLHKE